MFFLSLKESPNGDYIDMIMILYEQYMSVGPYFIAIGTNLFEPRESNKRTMSCRQPASTY